MTRQVIPMTGLFNPKAVTKLVEKCKKMSDKHLSFKDNMSFISILSTQLLYEKFIDNFEIPRPIEKSEYKNFIDLR